MLTEKDFKDFFAKVEAQAETIENEVEKDIAKAAAAVGSFLRSTAAALAKDPVLLAVVQAGMAGGIASVAAAVESGGASVAVEAAAAAGREILIAAGHTAEHELVPIVVAEIHAAVISQPGATVNK